MEITQRIRLLLSEMNRGVYEKETEINLSLLAALAGESILLQVNGSQAAKVGFYRCPCL